MTEPHIIWLRPGLSGVLGDRSFNVKGSEPYVEAAPVAELLERIINEHDVALAIVEPATYRDTQTLLAALREHESRPS